MNRIGLALLAAASFSHANRIIVNNDEWTFANSSYSGPGSGFSQPNDGTQFALNVADWLTAGTSGNSLLNLSGSFGLNNSTLASTFTTAGYQWTNNPSGLASSITLQQMLAYDAVFVGGSQVNASVLTQYVNAGGNVYVMAGTGYGPEDGWWDPFLNNFGLDLGPGYNGLGSPYSPANMSIPVSGSHAILAGIDHLQMGNGNSVFDINVSDARSQVIASYQGMGLLGVFDGNPNQAPAAVPEPGTFALMGLGLAGLGCAARRRRNR